MSTSSRIGELRSRTNELATELEFALAHPDVARLRIDELRQKTRALSRAFELLFAFDAAVGLAFFERTGSELQPGADYDLTDAIRAEKIMELYPLGDAQ